MTTPISGVRYVALAVPEFAAERAFLCDLWLLREEHARADTAYLAAEGSAEPFVLRLRQGQDRRADLFALAAQDRAGVEWLWNRARQKGARIVWDPRELDAPGGGYGFRLFDPDGRLIEISADVQPRKTQRPEPKAAVPQALSHLVFHAPDLKATVAWYEDVLGMRVSDWLDGFMCFLRGNGQKHHCLAFLVGPASLNHTAFEMLNADEMMRGLGRMLKNGITVNWGPGRHTAGDNTFSYFRSPAGNIFEYTAELENVPEDWQPRTFPRAPEIIDQWGTGRISGPASYPPLQRDPALWNADAP